MSSLTITFGGEEKKVWSRVLDYVRENPGVIYKGIPLTVLTYLTFPYAFTFWKVVPWVWAGYEAYQRIPSGLLR